MTRKLLHLFSLLAFRRVLLAQGTTLADPRSGPIQIPPQKLRPTSLVRGGGGGGPGRNPEGGGSSGGGGGSSSGSPTSSGDRVRRRPRRRHRNLLCGEPSSAPSAPPPPGANVLNSYWHELQGNRTGSSFKSGNQTTPEETSDNDKDSAAGRFADAGGALASGQSVGGEEETTAASRRPSAAPTGDGSAGSTAAPSGSPSLAPSAPPGPSSAAASSCPDATPGQLVACQGGTVRFASLCHAKQALKGSLTDCLLVDSAPVESSNSSISNNVEGGDEAGAPKAAAAAAADPIPPALAAAAAASSSGAGAGAPGRGCPEDEDEDEVGLDQVRLVLCDGDMLFASWCDALRHHFTREQCEEY